MNKAKKCLKLIFIMLTLCFLMAQNDCQLDEQILKLIDSSFSSSGINNKIYISNLSFLDVETKSILAIRSASQINEVVQEGMHTLAQSKKNYVVGSPAQFSPLVDNDANGRKLVNIFWDPNLNPKEKIERIIRELMEPHGIDGLVAGQYLEKSNGALIVRPFVISRSNKSLVTESLLFKPEEFLCRDPANPSIETLCDSAHEEIKDAVIRLLKQL